MTDADAGVNADIANSSALVDASAADVPAEPVIETPVAAPPPTPSPASAPEVPATPSPAPEAPHPTPEPPAPQPVQASSSAAPAITSYLSRALEKIQFRKRAKLDKILALAAKRREIGLGPDRKAGLNVGEEGGVAEISSRKLSVTIKNDDVEKLLRVSDATASRYLAQLVKEGKLKRSGKPELATYEPA